MKTNVQMVRKMGSLDVFQRTSDGMFNATALLQQWAIKTGQKKQVSDFSRLAQTQQFIDEMQKDQSQAGIYPNGDNQILKVIKGRNTKNGKTSDQVWYHPYLFIKFAMWLNPRFELQVIKFIHDQLIEFRHEAGDNYTGLTSAVQKFQNIDYAQLAKGLNWIVFDRHEAGIRQTASQNQLKHLVSIQKQLAFACDMGYIRTFDELINDMRRIYHTRQAVL